MAEQEENQQERTEPATPKRREDARKKGNVAKSYEINSSAVLLISLFFLFFAGAQMLATMNYYSQLVFENVSTVNLTADNLKIYIELAAISLLKIIFPFIIAVMLIGILINLLQIGPLFTVEPLIPRFSRINPFTGFRRVLLSRKTVVELLKNVLKIVLVGVVAYLDIKGKIPQFVLLIDQSVSQIMVYTAMATFSLGIKITLVLIALSLADYLFQRFEYERSIRMTRQELREEYKQLEGDPQIKARIRSIQRELVRRRMMENIPKADVVITNPVEIAVALQYIPKEMEAPKVVAKGRRKIAEKIRALAIQNDIPIVENKPLAWTLYKAVNIGDFIPEHLFQAVAEVLAYVYRLKNKKLA